ncbi:uncharacterized protein [Musca autumnalis]|uniref:uncharacterized protein n=1 Tax=Musca autumnalis TaxID=221902 RepID=UPI003CEFAAE4
MNKLAKQVAMEVEVMEGPVPQEGQQCLRDDSGTVSTVNANVNVCSKRSLENGVAKKNKKVCGNGGSDEAGVIADKTNYDAKKRRINEDPILYPPEFMVLVDTSEAENIKNKKVKNGLYFIEKIKDIKSKEFEMIKRVDAIGVTLYKILFNDRESANAFTGNEELKRKKLRAFIPRNFVETFGVIRNVPLCFSEEDLLKGIVADRKVASVSRFTRKEGTEIRETETVKVGFSGDDHPAWVVFNYTVLVVNTYYPAVRQCFNCGRLGHTKMGCRSKARCLECGKEECDGKCAAKLYVLCNSTEHVCKDKGKCPKWAREIETNKIMTKKKMTKKEVEKMYNTQNRYDILWDQENFPDLPSNGTRGGDKEMQPKVDSIDDDINKILTPYSYNSVAKKPKKKYIHKPGVQMANRMFEEPSPSRPVFPHESQKVSELEKITKELVKFMQDFFINNNNLVGVEAMKHFQDRIQKCGFNMESVEEGVVLINHDGQAEIFAEDRQNRNKLINFNLVQKFRKDGYGGVAVALRKNIKFCRIPFETDQDILIIKTLNLRKNYIVVSAYFPPSVSFVTFTEEMSRLVLFLERFQNVVFCGDFNARNMCWGDHITSRKGKELDILTMEAGFRCLNDGKETFNNNKGSQGSVLDLSFVSSSIKASWRTLEGHWGGSHHVPISIEIDSGVARNNKFLHKKKLLGLLGNLELEPDFNMIEESIEEEIVAATTPIGAGRSPKYWWDDELSVLYRRQLAAVKKSQKISDLQQS